MANEATREQWNAFVAASPHRSFLQSWAWGEMQQRLSVPISRVTVEQAGHIVAAALVIERSLPWGHRWLYVPRGPIFKDAQPTSEQWQHIHQQLQALAQERQALFIRIEPPLPPSTAPQLTRLGWSKAERDVQPAHTIVVDLTPSESELLAAMHTKTRYNIRLAEKKGVTVHFANDQAGIDDFLQLTADVQSRSQFRFHPPEYYRAMQQVLGSSGQLVVGIAKHGDTLLAAHLLVTFADTMTYAHGASSSHERQLMAPHLLQWESIKRAQAQGLHYYDFFGVAPREADVSHPWSGITRFKEGFGGDRIEYLGAYDHIRDSAWYTAFTVARRLRKLWR